MDEKKAAAAGHFVPASAAFIFRNYSTQYCSMASISASAFFMGVPG